MGYIPAQLQPKSVDDLKDSLDPYTDNDFIRNSIYKYAERNPDKKILLN